SSFPQASAYRSPRGRPGKALPAPTLLLTECILSAYSGPVSVPLTLLGLLEREPSHGYDLKRDYDIYFRRGRPLPHGQPYAERAGAGEGGAAEPARGRGPDRRAAPSAPAVTAGVEARLDLPSEPEPHLQTVLFAKVVLALMLGRPAEHYLDLQRGAHLRRMR